MAQVRCKNNVWLKPWGKVSLTALNPVAIASYMKQ